MQTLAKSLFASILDTLNTDLDTKTFLSSHCFPRDEETSVCRLNYYPKCPNPSLHLGVGPHSDPGIVTVLLQDDSVSSLQVKRDGVWYDIPPVKGNICPANVTGFKFLLPHFIDSFVINIGDMMQVWSNGKYKGPVHQVLANHESDRFSLPYFLAPAYSCIVEPLDMPGRQKKYKPIHWGYFRKARYEGDYADKGEEIQISHFEL